MSFHEVEFPITPSYGSGGGPAFRTDIIESDSGQETRVSRWSVPRHEYDLSNSIRSQDDLASLKTFFLARSGAAYGFRFCDFLDFTSNADGHSAPATTDQILGAGNGSQTAFQLVKLYGTRSRTITKPRADTVVVALDGVSQASGWSVNTTSGIVTFDVAPAIGVEVTAGFEFDVPVRFANDSELLAATLEEFDSGQAAVKLVEVLDSVAVSGEFDYGGSKSICVSANTTISLSDERHLFFDVSASGKSLSLPATTDVPYGGPIFVLTVNGYDLALKDSGGTLLATLTTGKAYEIWMTTLDNSGKAWLVL